MIMTTSVAFDSSLFYGEQIMQKRAAFNNIRVFRAQLLMFASEAKANLAFELVTAFAASAVST